MHLQPVFLQGDVSTRRHLKMRERRLTVAHSSSWVRLVVLVEVGNSYPRARTNTASNPYNCNIRHIQPPLRVGGTKPSPINFFLGMSLYDLHNATLEDIEGEGFSFSKKTVFGKKYQGVFFGDGISEEVDEEDEATFSGILYDRSREKEKTFSVQITNVTSTPAGERADFVATEKP